MDNRLARDPEAMTLAELDALIRTRLALTQAHHDVVDAARAGFVADARRAQRRVAELQHTMIAHGWWTEEQRTVQPTDDGAIVVRSCSASPAPGVAAGNQAP
jgi:hypothetical protein